MPERNTENVSRKEIFRVLFDQKKLLPKEDKDSNAHRTLSAREIMLPREQNASYFFNDTTSSNLKPLKTCYKSNFNPSFNDNGFNKSAQCKAIIRMNRNKYKSSEIKAKQNVSSCSLNERCSSNINQTGKVPEWDKVFKEILGNKSDLKTDEQRVKKEFSLLQKSDVSNKQKKQGSINGYRHPMMPDDSEMSEEEKKVWEEFARARLFTFDCPYTYNDFEGMGIDIFKSGKNIFAPWINFHMNEETRSLLARPDRYIEEKYVKYYKSKKQKQIDPVIPKCVENNKISYESDKSKELYTLWHQSQTLKKQMDPVYSKGYLKNEMSDERFMSKEHFPPLQKSSFSKKQMEQVSDKLFWSKEMLAESLTSKGQNPFVKKSSGKQMEYITDGHWRKKRLSQKTRKLEVKEEDNEILEKFVPSRYFKSIHRSGNAVSVYDDPNQSLLGNNIIFCNQKEEEWKMKRDDPLTKLPALPGPVEPLPELPPISYDEEPWDEEFYF